MKLTKRMKRKLKKRVRWFVTRILPVCACGLLVLGGIGYGGYSLISLMTAKPARAAAVEDMQLITAGQNNDSAENLAGDTILVSDTGQIETDAVADSGQTDSEASADPGQVDATDGEGSDLGQADIAVGSGNDPGQAGDAAGTGDFYAEEVTYTGGLGDDVLAEYGILIDPANNTIISSRKGKERMIPASMTKVLTLLVAAEHVKSLDDTVTITAEMGYYAYQHDLSIVGFKENEVVTVRDLMYGTILPSGGDAAMALAIYTAGSHEAFVDLMNDKVAELGLADTSHFTNCVGIYDDNHYSTCYDIAMIMEAAMNNEMCRPILTARKYTTSATTEHPDGIEISNWFLRRIEDKDCGGADVLYAKTGYVKESGFNAVSYAQAADGTGYICVTVNSGSTWKCIYDHVRIYSKIFDVAG